MTVYAVAYQDDRYVHIIPTLVFHDEQKAIEAADKRTLLTRPVEGSYQIVPINIVD